MRIQNVEGNYTIPENFSLHSVRIEGIIVECNTANDPVAITLPPLTAYPNVKDLKIIVVDATGDSKVNKITVELAQEEGVTDIDGELSWTIENESDVVVFSRITEKSWTASKQIVEIPEVPTLDNQLYGHLKVVTGEMTVSIQRNELGGNPVINHAATGTYELTFPGTPFADLDKIDFQFNNPWEDMVVVGRITANNKIVFLTYYLPTQALVNVSGSDRLRFHITEIG